MSQVKQSAVVLVFSSEGELALQLRAAGDDKYPLHWDFSAAGGIEVGEEPEHAAKRELKEEIGIEGELEFVGEEIYEGVGRDDYLYIYSLTHSGPFMVDPHEVDKVEFFSFEQIERMLHEGEKFHPEFPWLWQKRLIQSCVEKRNDD